MEFGSRDKSNQRRKSNYPQMKGFDLKQKRA
jgi:hypothetical protein